MATPSIAQKRLQSDYLKLLSEPLDNLWAHPISDNILEWHYAIRAPDDCPFAGGLYHGKLVFTEDYPMKPPAIYMFTPNGKFNTDSRICLAGISDLHPECWSPVQTVSSIMISLFSFMIDAKCGVFAGQDKTTVRLSTDLRLAKQRDYALKSWDFNLNNKTFCELFPELVEEAKSRKK